MCVFLFRGIFVLGISAAVLASSGQPGWGQVSDEELRRERIETLEQLKGTEEVFGSSSRFGAGMLDKYGWLINYGGVTSLSYTGGSNNDRSSGQGVGTLDSTDHNYDYELNLFTSVQDKAKLTKFYVRLKTKYIEQKKAGTAGSVRGNDYEQANFDLTYFEKKIPAKNVQHTWTLGRQFISVGRGIAYAQVADGLNVNVRMSKTWVETYKLFAVRQNPRDDNTDIYNASTTRDAGRTLRQFYGVELKIRIAPKHRFTFFYVINDDKNRETHPIAGRHQYDSKFLGYGLDGSMPFMSNLTYFAEHITLYGKNFGRAVINSTTPRDRVNAFAFDMGLKYAWRPNKYAPSLHLQYSAASGDPDRVASPVGSTAATALGAGNTSGTTDKAFQPFGGLSLGYALAPTFSNIRALQFGGSVKPWKNTRLLNNAALTVAYYIYRKDVSSGPMSDPFATAGAPRDDLGNEWNCSVNWKIFSDLRTELRLGHFRPGEAYGSTRSSEKYIKYKLKLDL